MGAEVIHVESTSHPDGMRMTGYLYGRPDWWEWGHMFVAVNTDKLALTLDVDCPAGRELCTQLIEWADVVVENFSPRVVESWGFDRDRRPRHQPQGRLLPHAGVRVERPVA